MIGTLAAACAEAGDFDEAVADAQEARDLAVPMGNKGVASKNAESLKPFRFHQACHE